MEDKDWIKSYNELNNSFKKTLVFRVGIEAGFFSEINHMLLAMLYCLKNNIKFTLSSVDSNFSYNRGWEDYFLPFCEESYSKIHLKNNARSYHIKTSVTNIIKSKFIRKYLGVNYLTQDIWPYIKDAKFHNENFDIPSLSIKGDLLSAIHVLTKNIWRYKPDIEQAIQNKVKTIQLPLSYIGIHIRSGDIEKKKHEVSSYINLIKSLSTSKDLFVATDDYSSIRSLKIQFPDYKIYSFCDEKEEGWNEGAFNNSSKESKKEILINLLADTEALCQSSVFVGTLSSNVGMFVGIRRKGKLWYGVDANDWRIF